MRPDAPGPDVYVASAIPTEYPLKLQKPATLGKGNAPQTAESFIMDSGIGDSVDNETVLDLAHEVDADYVIAKDYLHDQDRTTRSVEAFFEIYESHPCDSTPMVPLQPPHHRHYQDLQGFDHYVLGGMAGESVTPEDAVDYVRRAAAVIPDGAYIHALGIGGGRTVAEELAGEGLIDSLDCSTPERAAMFGCVLDRQLRQTEVKIHTGKDTRLRTAPLAELNSYQIQDYWTKIARESGDSRQTNLSEVPR
jgi:hypothetical protein